MTTVLLRDIAAFSALRIYLPQDLRFTEQCNSALQARTAPLPWSNVSYTSVMLHVSKPLAVKTVQNYIVWWSAAVVL